jgi:phosphoenolpyruvate carboxykinase (ATP)
MEQETAMSDDLNGRVARLMAGHSDVRLNLGRKSMIADVVARREAMVAACGCLAVWTPPESTGRSPQDTVIVRRPESEKNIDWDAPNNLPITTDTFDMVFADALAALGAKPRLYAVDRVLGADPGHALPVRVVSDRALTVLFADNMFRPVPADINSSCFVDRPYTLLVCPYDKLDPARYAGRLRTIPKTGKASNMVIAMDMDRRIGVVFGSAYCGSVKKHMFTVMNYLLPLQGILPLHCSANEGRNGNVALLLGLSGTGKTTLSADPRRTLLGDDEHSWSDNGVANFENGCYAKLINLSPVKEPDIYRACFHEAPYLEHGAIVENAMVYPAGRFDLDDERYTPNSRGSYPLSFLSSIKTPPVAGHPKTILFLTADANGVLPPVARLTRNQAMLWFLMGYTSKLAGTETGVVEPKSTFSRFFGAPFMPLNPDAYARMLGEKLDRHGTSVYLVNTGWSGGPYGVGRRMDIALTRELVEGALSGALETCECEEDRVFHLSIPTRCPGISDQTQLSPRSTWPDKAAYDERAKKLAAEFCAQFDKSYGAKAIDLSVARECPGK